MSALCVHSTQAKGCRHGGDDLTAKTVVFAAAAAAGGRWRNDRSGGAVVDEDDDDDAWLHSGQDVGEPQPWRCCRSARRGQRAQRDIIGGVYNPVADLLYLSRIIRYDYMYGCSARLR